MEYPQNRVSKTVWPWQNRAGVHVNVPPSMLFSLTTLLIAWGVGTLFYFTGHLNVALLAYIISTFVFIASRFFLKLYKVIESGFQKLSAIVGKGITLLLLVPFFYICFSIGRLAQILKRNDPMLRTLHPEAGSYWKQCKETSSVEDYKRQF